VAVPAYVFRALRGRSLPVTLLDTPCHTPVTPHPCPTPRLLAGANPNIRDSEGRPLWGGVCLVHDGRVGVFDLLEAPSLAFAPGDVGAVREIILRKTWDEGVREAGLLSAVEAEVCGGNKLVLGTCTMLCVCIYICVCVCACVCVCVCVCLCVCVPFACSGACESPSHPLPLRALAAGGCPGPLEPCPASVDRPGGVPLLTEACYLEDRRLR
jgi:hypothetical protein